MLKFIKNRDGHIDLLRKINEIQQKIGDRVSADLTQNILLYSVPANRGSEFLCAAICADDVEAIEILRQKWKFTCKAVARKAAASGSVRVLEYALKNFNISKREIDEALFCAARANSHRATRLLLERNPSHRAVSRAALGALADENISVANILVNAGADIFSEGIAFRHACASGHLLAVEYYLERTTNERDFRFILGGDYGEMTALEEAARHGHIIIVRLVFCAADRFGIADDYVFDTLNGAQEAGHEDIAEYIHVSISDGVF